MNNADLVNKHETVGCAMIMKSGERKERKAAAKRVSLTLIKQNKRRKESERIPANVSMMFNALRLCDVLNDLIGDDSRC